MSLPKNFVVDDVKRYVKWLIFGIANEVNALLGDGGNSLSEENKKYLTDFRSPGEFLIRRLCYAFASLTPPVAEARNTSLQGGGLLRRTLKRVKRS